MYDVIGHSLDASSHDKRCEKLLSVKGGHNKFIQVVSHLRGNTGEYIGVISVVLSWVVVRVFTVGVFFSNRESCVSAAV